MCPQRSNYQLVIFGSNNGLAPNRHLAIIWTNNGVIYCCKYASFGLNELKLPACVTRKILKSIQIMYV